MDIMSSAWQKTHLPVSMLVPLADTQRTALDGFPLDFFPAWDEVPWDWQTTRGEKITIGVLSTGLPDHPALAGRIINSANFSKSPLHDEIGHATAICGVISDLAPLSQMVVAKGLDDRGGASDVMLAQALTWLIDQGVDVINFSLGADYRFADRFLYTTRTIRRAHQQGVAVVCPAGYSCEAFQDYPAMLSTTLSVDMACSNFTSLPKAWNPPDLLVGAGQEITTTWKDGGYSTIEGVVWGLEAAQVTGLIALLLSRHRLWQGLTPIDDVTTLTHHLKSVSLPLSALTNCHGQGRRRALFTPETPCKKSWWSCLTATISRLLGR